MCWQLDPLINGWLVAWRGPQTCAVGNVFIPPTATGFTIAAQMTGLGNFVSRLFFLEELDITIAVAYKDAWTVSLV